jgi:hypothetical protein
MPSRNETLRARDRLQSATPTSLLKLDEEVSECLREAKRDDHLRPDGFVSTVVDGVARSYFTYIFRNKRARHLFGVERELDTKMDEARYIPPHRWRDRRPRFAGSHPPPSWLLLH